MLSKNKIKFLKSLSDKRTRTEFGVFMVEGEKMVKELLHSGYKVSEILLTEENASLISKITLPEGCSLYQIGEQEMARISGFRTPPGIAAVAVLPFPGTDENKKPDITHWAIALDDIQDPGNLGTIIRTADWFDIRTILCSKNTADVYNPKVLQSTMGAVFRVNIHYVDLPETLSGYRKDSGVTLLAAILNGENVYHSTLPSGGILMMGNESKGLSDQLINLADKKICIPNFGHSGFSGESLNVSMATGILLSEIRRRDLK